MGCITARDFCNSFFKEYENNRIVRRSYEKKASAPRKNFRDKTEWTSVMGIFLEDLAEKNGLIQMWEVENTPGKRDHVDFGWYEKDSSEAHALIEHEINIDCALEEEVPKLIRKNVGLKVVITYTNFRKYSNWLKKEIEKNQKKLHGFVLLVGDWRPEDPGQRPFEWRIYGFGKDGLEEEKRQMLEHLKPGGL